MDKNFDQQRARDALAFDPLPEAGWVSIGEHSIILRVNYSERLSRGIRCLPGAKWDASDRVWRVPFSSADALREKFEELNALAVAAKETADKETENRRIEKQKADEYRAAARKRRDTERIMSRPRPLRSEFLTSCDAPLTAITLEAIGDDTAALPLVGAPPRQWVAQIVGVSANGKWARMFLNGARDYASANSSGSRGITVTYLLNEGLIYEVSSPQTWRKTDRYFCRAQDGSIIKITEQEVRECLVNPASE